ncbi:phospholipase D family protein [Sulfurimonas sp. HSL1-2]|uniref:phospholipase D family protein n=1 Tax=Thiomicrolovo zhangzhouensis TaxID=3131933 RepID=UPI0031F83BB6
MQIIADNVKLREKLVSLIDECDRIQIASAWASAGNIVVDALLQNKEKIQKLIVGTHFFQTDPKFLAAFEGFEKARVRMHEGAVFHPKIYYFDMGNNGWECLIGSANLTNAAMGNNDEIMVLVSDSDADASTAQLDIWKVMGEWEKNAKKIDNEFINFYTKLYKAKSQALQSVATPLPPKDSERTFDSEIFSLTWEEFFNEIQEFTIFEKGTIIDRDAVLSKAHQLFSTHQNFAQMGELDRKKIGGFYERIEDGLDWRWFGSMKGSGDFKKQINDNNPHISSALDLIPNDGTVTREDYLAYIDEFSKSFTEEQNRLATSTRLLTMKRPDYFMCVDSQNKRQLCRDFGIIERELNIDTYWDLITAQIINCAWWSQDPSVLTGLQRSVWNGRAAFLDALYYQNIVRSNAKPFLQSNYPELLRHKLCSSRKWEEEGDLGNWWFKFSEDDLKSYEYIVLAGALDDSNHAFKLFKIPTQYIIDHLDKLDCNAEGRMINIYLSIEDHIDLRNDYHLSFKEFCIN